MSKPVVIYVNGIMHEPGSADSWVRRAASWTTRKTRFDGEVFLYEAGPVTRRFTLNKRAKELAQMIAEYSDNELHLAVHSNGGEVLTRALREILQRPEAYPAAKIVSAHFLGPANDADFTKNWINSALIAGLVGHVHVYRATDDDALKWGRASRRLFGWIGLGYGDLGLVGPQNVEPSVVARVHDHPGVAPCHTCFFDEQHFTKTLTFVLENCDIAAGKMESKIA
jgi:hypothetical protein